MTYTSIISRLTDNFFSRLTLLFSKTTHLNFWDKLLAKNTVTQETSYNLAPLVGAVIGFIIAFVAILGRLAFSYRICATLVALACYLFFGFANALYELALTIGEGKNVDTAENNVNKFGIIAIILAVIVWCTCVTYMRPARLFLSLMSSICISRFASCIVIYIKNCQNQTSLEREQIVSYDKVDLIVSMICTAPWLILSLERCFASVVFATAFAIIITKYLNHCSSKTAEKISGTTIVATEIFSLLIWLI